MSVIKLTSEKSRGIILTKDKNGIIVNQNNEYINIIIDILRGDNVDKKALKMEKYLETKYNINKAANP